MLITKTRYVKAVQCLRRLWLETYQPQIAAAPSLAEQRLMQQGIDLGVLAHTRFPGGVLIEQSGYRATAATQRALLAGHDTLFEATFRHEDCLVRCDVLEQNQGAWTIVEVKSSTSVYREHLHDLAIQRFVVEHAGLRVARTKLMYVNTAASGYPDLSDFFVIEDVTEQVCALLPEVEERLAAIRAALVPAEEPPAAIGMQCRHPGPCPFTAHCWAGVPAVSIYTIPRLDWNLRTQLAARGIVSLTDLPPDLELNDQQRTYVRTMTSGGTEIDLEAIEGRLQTLSYPIHFFDFETDAPAVPQFAGLRPFQGFPFQYSCHVLHADGRLEHHEYLHLDVGDPRRPLVESLIRHIGPEGSVVVYYANFERSILSALIEALPAYRAQLQSVIDRLWDQYEIFRDFYHSAAFHGSKSLKYVLPAIVPHLSYEHLAVRKGDQAQAVWRAMIEDTDEQRKQRTAADLKAYCGLDTYAMVELHRALEKAIHQKLIKETS